MNRYLPPRRRRIAAWAAAAAYTLAIYIPTIWHWVDGSASLVGTVVQLAIPVFGLWLWHQIRTAPPTCHDCFGPFTSESLEGLIKSGGLAGFGPNTTDVDETRP